MSAEMARQQKGTRLKDSLCESSWGPNKNSFALGSGPPDAVAMEE